jgi:peptide/nickel transport system substrate-binding protein
MKPILSVCAGVFVGLTSSVLALSACPAIAQKSQNIVRIALPEPIKGFDPYYFPVRDANFYTYEIYEPLIRYHEGEGEFIPALAKSWRRIDPTTLEFDLRDDIKFTNGDAFEADDVVKLLAWRNNPKTRLQFKGRTAMFAGAEKLGPHKIRIRTKGPTATDLMVLARSLPILDSKVLDKLEDRADYGKSPIGTGSIRVVSFDNTAGVVVEPNPPYDRGPKPAYARLIGVPLPDRQTQTAHLLAGTVDAIKVETKDQWDEMAKLPNLTAYSRSTFALLVMEMDVRGRSGLKALQDPRVRKAMMMAIDRKSLAENLIPGKAELANAQCLKGMLACRVTTEPPAYDPEGAKKLLAEAGYPNGFDLVIQSRTLARNPAVAIAGQFRAIGIGATVDYRTVIGYRKARDEGILQVAVVDTPVGSTPDASNPLEQSWGNDSYRLVDDDQIMTWKDEALREFDPEKRAAIYARIFDRINERHYAMPIATWPDGWLLANGLKVTEKTWRRDGVAVQDFTW